MNGQKGRGSKAGSNVWLMLQKFFGGYLATLIANCLSKKVFYEPL